MTKYFYIACCLLTVFSIWIHAASAQEVSIPDPNLAFVVRRTFSLPADAKITKQMMQELTNLNAQRAKISDLTGLEHAINLRELNLNSNQLNDINALSDLIEIQTLSLASNQINDIKALEELTQLTTLSLGSNQISDINALAGLTALRNLFLVSNQINDITSLTALTQLEQLSLWDNQISDISALAGMTQLKNLYLVSNEIIDIKPLTGLTDLSELWLDNNQISDLSPLSNLTQLVDLSLGSNQISVVIPLSGLTQLESLSLESNQIRIVTPLRTLTRLESLYLNSNQISSIRPLRDLTNLEELYISDNPISDIFQVHQMIAAGVDVDFETSVPNESQVALTRVLFNEIRNAPDDRNDWIELKNISNSGVSLSEWEIGILTRKDSSVSEEIDIVSFPDRTLPAGGILLITNTDPRQTTLLRGRNIRTPDIRDGAQHEYLVTDKLQLPNIPYLLILRSAINKNGTQEAIEDVAGTYFLDTLTADQPLTQGTAWQRTSIAHVGYDVEAWNESGYQAGIGYQPTAPEETSPGTPGYHNNALASESRRGQISISEVMFTNKIGNRTVPQWIELYNNSRTEAVNLNGWKITYEYREGRQNKSDEKELQNLVILPKQTVVIVSETLESKQNIPDRRVYDLFAFRFGDFQIPSKGQSFLASDGFFVRLSTLNGAETDIVGNLDGDSDTQDTPLWELPTGTSENGSRISMLRRYHHQTRYPLAGTEISSWRSATDAKLGKSTYYGDQTDIGNPGYTLGGVLPVSLSSFQAEQTAEGVVIKWTTESEVDNAGFYIYRSETKDGNFKVVNSQMIQGAGTTGERNAYTWTDTTAKPNTVYYYHIEDVSHAGVREQLATVRLRGLVSASGKLTTRWADFKVQD